MRLAAAMLATVNATVYDPDAGPNVREAAKLYREADARRSYSSFGSFISMRTPVWHAGTMSP